MNKAIIEITDCSFCPYSHLTRSVEKKQGVFFDVCCGISLDKLIKTVQPGEKCEVPDWCKIIK